MNKKKLAILFGGENTEYEVSLKSAYSVLKNINNEIYDVNLIGITKKGSWLYYNGSIEKIKNDTWYKDESCIPAFIPPCKSFKGIVKVIDYGKSYEVQNIDVVFPIIHGKNAEDGTIQGVLTLSGIPFVGCDTIASSVCMDKSITNAIIDAQKIKQANWICLNINKDEKIKNDEIQKITKRITYPLFVKPANSGSSVGVSKANNNEELLKAIETARKFDNKIVIEQCIVGRELEIAVMGNENPVASCVGEVFSESEFYSYESKYESSKSYTEIPAKIDEEIQSKIKEIAIKAFKSIGCSGLSRVDFFLDKDENIFLNEINTMPGFTDISMFPKLFIQKGKSYSQIIDELINLAIKNHKTR